MIKNDNTNGAFDNFFKKLVSNPGIERGLSLYEMMQYLGDTAGKQVFLVVHGTSSITRVNTRILTYERSDAEGVLDYMLHCQTDGTNFKLSAKMLTPQNNEILKSNYGINFSRLFTDAKERDAYFEDLMYIIETDAEAIKFISKKVQSEFLEELKKQYKKRNSSKPDEDPSAD